MYSTIRRCCLLPCSFLLTALLSASSLVTAFALAMPALMTASLYCLSLSLSASFWNCLSAASSVLQMRRILRARLYTEERVTVGLWQLEGSSSEFLALGFV